MGRVPLKLQNPITADDLHEMINQLNAEKTVGKVEENGIKFYSLNGFLNHWGHLLPANRQVATISQKIKQYISSENNVAVKSYNKMVYSNMAGILMYVINANFDVIHPSEYRVIKETILDKHIETYNQIENDNYLIGFASNSNLMADIDSEVSYIYNIVKDLKKSYTLNGYEYIDANQFIREISSTPYAVNVTRIHKGIPKPHAILIGRKTYYNSIGCKLAYLKCLAIHDSIALTDLLVSKNPHEHRQVAWSMSQQPDNAENSVRCYPYGQTESYYVRGDGFIDKSEKDSKTA